ncbi:SGNH domain-containing protein [Plasmodiophora brassicae]
MALACSRLRRVPWCASALAIVLIANLSVVTIWMLRPSWQLLDGEDTRYRVPPSDPEDDDDIVGMYPVDKVAAVAPGSSRCTAGVVLESAFAEVPARPRPGRRRHSRCRMSDWTDGEWALASSVDDVFGRTGLYMQYENRFKPDYSDRQRQPWLWEWRSTCGATMDKFDPVRLCSTLGNRSILFVGDSLSANMIAAFRNQLNTRRAVRPCANDNWSDEYESTVVICPSMARLDYIRNDHLTLSRDSQGQFCNAWTPVLDQYDILVLNTGAHVVDIDEYERQTGEVVEYLRQHYHGTVVYRLTSAGHANCTTYSEPWTRAQADRHAAEHPELPYKWHYFATYNDIARLHYASLPRAYVLDTDSLVRLRPDTHRSADDCLHQVIPAALDYAVLMLYYVIVGDLEQ